MARLAKSVKATFIFGNLAVVSALVHSCRPMALRPRFSTGLLLSDLIDYIIAICDKFILFIYEI